jgi:uncharacterized protein (DUF58 family)
MNGRCQVRIRAVGWCYAIVTAIIWLCAVLRDMPLLYLLAATLLGPLLFSWRQARRGVRQLSGARRVPPRPHAGQTVVVELALRNEGADRSAWAIGLADRWERAGGEATAVPMIVATPATPAIPVAGQSDGGASTETPARVFFPHIGPNAERTESYLWRPGQRGRYSFAAAKLSSRFPLGLFEATRLAVPATEVLVVPALGRLKGEWRGWCDRAGREAAGTSQRRGLLEGDYYGLREWRPGDSRRWIHWRSSARQGSLTTLQFEQPRREELFLVVDLWAAESPTADQREAVERVLSFAATVVADFGRRGDRVLRFALAAAKSQIWLEPLRATDRDELLDALAVAEPTVAPDLAEATRGAESARSGKRLLHGAGASAGRWAVASTRPASPEALARLAAAGISRGASPLWIDFSALEARSWFALAGEP